MLETDLKQLIEYPHHLFASVTGQEAPLLDEKLERDRENDIWYHHSDELWTPMSFPLRLSLSLFYKTGFQVWSASTKILQVDCPDVHLSVRLWLPTDEFLAVSIMQQSRYPR